MPRSERRQAALTFCLATVALVACLFICVCVLSYNPADAPGSTIWPAPQPPANACGQVGAFIAHHLFHNLGIGVYPLILLTTAAVIATMRLKILGDTWLRFVGLMLIVAAFSTAASMFPHLWNPEYYPLSGPGGVLGTGLAYFCQKQLQTIGTLVVLACAFVVGLVLAADEWVLLFARLFGWAGHRGARVIARGSTVITGSATAGLGRLSARLATAGADSANNAAQQPPQAPPAIKPSARTAVKSAPANESPAPGATAAATTLEKPQARQLGLDDERDLEAPPMPDLTGQADSRRSSSAATARIGHPESFARSPAANSGSASKFIPDNPPTAAAAPNAKASPATQPAPATDDDGPPPVKERQPAPKPDPVVTQLAPTPQHGRLTDFKPSAQPFKLASGEEYKLPPPAILEDATPIDKESIEILCREKAYILEQTLNEFRLEVRVVAIETGPVITVFELKLAPGIKVSQIVSLSNDMARALKAPAVRVVAPLPGKNTIGIEVPNIDKEKVRLKDLMRMSTPKYQSHGVPLFLGKDAAGQPVVADLTQMPHLLIAGTTGSGKSICVSSIVMSVLLTKSPSEVQMILVDPKVVELSIFKEIPHLMCPIVTEASKAEGILDWAATKMDERYALLAEAGVKDIRSYNRLGRDGLRDRFGPIEDEELDKIPQFLPYMVIVIDELADLMMTSAKEVEFYLCRLAQKSRAVGIHLIVSTQRPQANVVTGLIKSNLPCRIAFRVSSRLDSRIVLDQNGGEVLLGQGDMLYLPPGSSKLVRAQGTFISDEELRSVVKHACAQATPQFHPELVRMPGAGQVDGERDELFDSAVDMIIESGRGSVSLLQRRLEVGYSRASRLIDQMYASGIVGEYKGSQAREVLMAKEDWQKIRAARDREEAAEASLEENG